MALVTAAARARTIVRPCGSSHSHVPLIPTGHTIVDTSGLCGVESVDTPSRRAWVRAGTPIYALGPALHQAGLGLPNQGDIDRQTIAGATATGTHGTGSTLTNLSAAVTGVRVALASGELVTCSADERTELWQAARLSLGAVGLVTCLEVQLRDAYRLREHGWTEHLDSMLPKLAEIVHGSRHFEFFWYPHTGMCVTKATEETDDPPEYPVADEGSRCAWSYEVLPNHRTWPHTEMEYSVPLERGPECLGAIRDLVTRDFPDLRYPVEYRTVAADDVWLSTAFERPTATISMHVAIGEDDEPLFRACEQIFLAFDGRPHWGKVHYRTGPDFAGMYDHWDDWWRVRDAHDPGGVFMNEYLTSLRAG